VVSARRKPKRASKVKVPYGEQAAKIRVLLAEGKSPAETARALGCSRQAVYKAQIQTATVGAPRKDLESPECPTCGQLAKTARARELLRAQSKRSTRT